MENNITNKGWEKMRALLDREMPQKNRRRFAWWWFVLLLLPVAGFGGWKWRNSSTEPTQKHVKSPKQIYADIPETKRPTAEQSSVGASSAAILPSVGVGRPTISTQKIPKKTEIVYAPSCLNDNQIIVEPLPPDWNLSADPMAPPHIQIDYLAGKMAVFVNPTAFTEHFCTPSLQNIPSAQKPLKNSAWTKWAVGATTTIATEKFSSINSFSTGLSVDWKFNHRWGLRSGALYNIYTPEEQDRPVASVLSGDYTSKVEGNVILLDLITGNEVTNTNASPAYGDSLSSQVFIPINRLERLELPIQAFWQPALRWKVLSGISLVRTLTTQADRQNYSGSYILQLADQAAEDGASKLSSGELAKWSVDATLGFGVQLGKILEIGLSAKLPIQKLTYASKRDPNGAYNGVGADQINTSLTGQRRPTFALSGTIIF